MKVRIVMVSGPEGSGKTSLVKAVLGDVERFAFMANNEKSKSELEGIPTCSDAFPMRTPCARPRQFKIRLENLLERCDVPLVLAEPPGMCSETCAPILNQLHVFDGDRYELGPLILVLDPESAESLWRNDVAGQKNRLCVDEADVVSVSMSDKLSVKNRERIRDKIESINDGCLIVFHSILNGEGIKEISSAVINGNYSRALGN